MSEYQRLVMIRTLNKQIKQCSGVKYYDLVNKLVQLQKKKGVK